jgi:hypothetical protein
MKVFLSLLIMSLTSVAYCQEMEEPTQDHVDFAQKYEAVFREKPSNEIWVRKGKDLPPHTRCGCCTNCY